ncbi:MAG: hypothetical protein ACC619_02655 [Paracoccaceae bacterium]
MTRPFTASVLALSIGLGAMTGAPAQASNNDLAKFLAGVTALVIIGKVIENSNKKPAVTRRYQPLVEPPRPKHNVSRTLPAECYFKVRTDDGRRGVFGQSCLREFVPHWDRLPAVCKETIRVRYGRSAKVFDARCLSKRGYRVEAALH